MIYWDYRSFDTLGDITPVVENHREKNMEHEMKTTV